MPLPFLLLPLFSPIHLSYQGEGIACWKNRQKDKIFLISESQKVMEIELKVIEYMTYKLLKVSLLFVFFQVYSQLN